MKKEHLNLVETELKLRDCALGSKILYHASIPSTMSAAKELALSGCVDGTVIIAGEQDSGRGRLGKSWSSPRGGLWLSTVLRPQLSPQEISLISLAAGVGICRTIRKHCSMKAELKWPNDVLIRGKKVCGILAEGSINSGRVEYIVLGLGVNLNLDINQLPEELQEYASTLSAEYGKPIDFTDFLKNLLIELDSAYSLLLNDRTAIIALWKGYSITIGKKVSAISGTQTIIGTAVDITDTGSLVIELESGETIEVCSGEVSLRGVNPYA